MKTLSRLTVCAATFLMAAVGLPATPAFAKVKVYGGVDPTTISQGASAELRVVVEGARGDEARIELPTVTGLKIQTPAVVVPELSISTSIINGQMTQRRTATYRFSVVGVKPGRHTIKPFAVRVPGEPVAYTPRMEIKVEANKGNKQPLVFLQAKPQSRSVYVGEPIVVDIRLGRLLPYANNEIPDKKTIFLPTATPSRGLDGLSESSLIPTRPTLEVPAENGETVVFFEGARDREYQVFEKRLRWLPRQPGEYTFSEATYSAEIATRVERVRGFFEDRLVARDVQPALATTTPFTVKVKRLPQQGRPPTFSGLIGRVEQKVSVDRTQVAVGESLKLTREITGTGNLDLIEPPPIILPDGFKTFGTLIQREPGMIRQILDFAPRHNDATLVPGIELATFDTGRGVYVTQKSRPIQLAVRGNAGEALSLLPGTVSAANDLRGLKVVRATEPGVPGNLTTLFVLLPIGFGFVGMILGRMRRRAAADPQGQKKKAARRSLNQRLKAAETAHDVRVALAAYLSELTGEPDAKFLHDLREPLEERVSAAVLDQVQRLASACDQVTFGGATRDIAPLVTALRNIAPRLRKELS